MGKLDDIMNTDSGQWRCFDDDYEGEMCLKEVQSCPPVNNCVDTNV